MACPTLWSPSQVLWEIITRGNRNALCAVDAGDKQEMFSTRHHVLLSSGAGRSFSCAGEGAQQSISCSCWGVAASTHKTSGIVRSGIIVAPITPRRWHIWRLIRRICDVYQMCWFLKKKAIQICTDKFNPQGSVLKISRCTESGRAAAAVVCIYRRSGYVTSALWLVWVWLSSSGRLLLQIKVVLQTLH